MNHKFTEKNNVVILEIEKLISEYENRKILGEAEQLIDDEKNNFIVDLSKLSYMNSAGFSFLIALLTKSRNSGGETIIINVSEHVSKLLIMMKLKNVFTVCENVEEAVAFFKKQEELSEE